MSRGKSLSKGKRRSAARLAAVQALYQMDIAGGEASSVVGEFTQYRLGEDVDGVAIIEADRALFGDLVLGVTAHRDAIDEKLGSILVGHWTLDKLELLVRQILRAGAYEITERPDIDAPLSISEYVDLTAAFFSKREPDFVNSVLDQLAKKHASVNAALAAGENPTPNASPVSGADAAPEANATPDADAAPEANATPDANAAPEANATPDVDADAAPDANADANANANATPDVDADAAPDANATPDADAAPDTDARPRPGAGAVSDASSASDADEHG